jgi:hypothetical protein
MTHSDAILSGAVLNGLNAQRKLNGDTTISGPDNHDHLQAIVSQGKFAEGQLRASGTRDALFHLKDAYRIAEVPFHEQRLDG